MEKNIQRNINPRQANLNRLEFVFRRHSHEKTKEKYGKGHKSKHVKMIDIFSPT